MNALDGLYGIRSNNPDLTRLRNVGTKLLHTSNLHDSSVWLQGHTDYYDRVVERMGGLAAVKDYYQLIVQPGLFHGSFNGSANREVNPPIAAAGQTYQALVDWVEKGVQPTAMVFRSPKGGHRTAGLGRLPAGGGPGDEPAGLRLSEHRHPCRRRHPVRGEL